MSSNNLPKQVGTKSQMKAAKDDGVPHHKADKAAPVTKSSGDGSASRNIVRKGGGASANPRKAGTSGKNVDDNTLEHYTCDDPNDPNFESPDDPDLVSNVEA